MDISSLAPTTTDLEILYPGTSGPIGLTLTLLPSDDPAVKAARNRIDREELAGFKKNPQNFTPKTEDEKRILICVAAISGWAWGDGPDGKPLTFEGSENPKFSKEAVERLLRLDKMDYIARQVMQELNNASAFFQKSAGS